MLEFVTSWLRYCSHLCTFWGCETYRRECHHVTFGTSANLQLCGIKEGATSSYMSLVVRLVLRFPILLQFWLFIPFPMQLFPRPPMLSQCYGLWEQWERLWKRSIPLKRKYSKHGSNDEMLIAPFPLTFHSLTFRSHHLRSMYILSMPVQRQSLSDHMAW